MRYCQKFTLVIPRTKSYSPYPHKSLDAQDILLHFPEYWRPTPPSNTHDVAGSQFNVRKS